MKINSQHIDISKKDIRLIERVVDRFAYTLDRFEILQYLRHAIGKDIKDQHFVVFGYLIGEKVATLNSDQKFKLNNFQLCQRQN